MRPTSTAPGGRRPFLNVSLRIYEPAQSARCSGRECPTSAGAFGHPVCSAASRPRVGTCPPVQELITTTYRRSSSCHKRQSAAGDPGRAVHLRPSLHGLRRLRGLVAFSGADDDKAAGDRRPGGRDGGQPRAAARELAAPRKDGLQTDKAGTSTVVTLTLRRPPKYIPLSRKVSQEGDWNAFNARRLSVARSDKLLRRVDSPAWLPL